MDSEDPPFIGDWYQQKQLGKGAFGIVTLWKNHKTLQCVGKINVSLHLLIEININIIFLLIYAHLLRVSCIFNFLKMRTHKILFILNPKPINSYPGVMIAINLFNTINPINISIN